MLVWQHEIVANRAAMMEIIMTSQRRIDIEHGPIFVVDNFMLPGFDTAFWMGSESQGRVAATPIGLE
jgi:hypothetical protein